MYLPIMPLILTVLIAGFLFGSLPATAKTFDWEAPKVADHEMAFRLYVPDDLPKVRSVIILTPGFKADGLRMVDGKAWKALAKKHQSALLGCSMRGEEGGKYYEVEKWGGEVLLEGLKKLAEASSHPEIATAPLAFHGYSAGGQFNYNFACWKPERTLAFVVNKGGYYGPHINAEVRRVPALWILGARDKDFRIQNITTLYGENRQQGALWALVTEPNASHEVARSSEIGAAFIDEALTSRLDAGGSIKPADTATAWLGDLATREITRNSEAGPGPLTHSWFPGQKTAELWKSIVSAPVVAPAPEKTPAVQSEN